MLERTYYQCHSKGKPYSQLVEKIDVWLQRRVKEESIHCPCSSPGRVLLAGFDTCLTLLPPSAPYIYISASIGYPTKSITFLGEPEQAHERDFELL